MGKFISAVTVPNPMTHQTQNRIGAEQGQSRPLSSLGTECLCHCHQGIRGWNLKSDVGV